MNTDRMTSKERIKSLMLNKPIDRVPFLAFGVGWHAIDHGMNLHDFYTQPEVAFRAGVMAEREHPWANIRPVYGWADHGAWEFGGKIAWPKSDANMTPYTPEPIVSIPEEVKQLSEPEPLKTEWVKLRFRFNEICVQKGYSAHLPSAGIMAQLSSMLGPENLLKWMIKYPDAVHHLAEKVLNFNLKTAQITLKKYGAGHCSVMTDLTLEGNDVISPEAFEAFCLPYILKMHAFYFESGVRATLIHLCGNHKENFKYWERIPVPDRTIFSIGDVMDLKETADQLDERYIIAGNISTTVLQVGKPDQVKKEVERCLNQGKGRAGGFILMPACELPPMTPRENFEAIREALMEHGFY